MWIATAYSVFLAIAALGTTTVADGDVITLVWLPSSGSLCDPTGWASVHEADGKPRFLAPVAGKGCNGDTANELLYDPSGMTYVSRWMDVVIFNSSFDFVSAQSVPLARDLAMDRDGTVFALSDGGEIRILTPSETAPPIEVLLPVRAGFFTPSMDFGLDGCTLYYIEAGRHLNERTLKAYDMCTRAPLPDVRVPAGAWCGYPRVRVAPDGRVFVADCQSVYRLDGGRITSYSLPGNAGAHRGIAFTRGGRTFWSASASSRLVEVDIASGAIVRGPIGYGGHAVAICGVPRAASQAAITAIPVMSPSTLALLAIAFAATAILRLAGRV